MNTKLSNSTLGNQRRNKISGKNFKLNSTYENVSFICGTSDVELLKTVYLEISFWIAGGVQNPDLRSKKLFKQCKQIIHEVNKNYFATDKLISILNFPTYAINLDTPTFTKFEFTLFRKPLTDNLDIILKLNETVDLIYNEIFEGDTEIQKRGTK